MALFFTASAASTRRLRRSTALAVAPAGALRRASPDGLHARPGGGWALARPACPGEARPGAMSAAEQVRVEDGWIAELARRGRRAAGPRRRRSARRRPPAPGPPRPSRARAAAGGARRDGRRRR